jgi:mannosyltransferase OCH1-like enzyme
MNISLHRLPEKLIYSEETLINDIPNNVYFVTPRLAVGKDVYNNIYKNIQKNKNYYNFYFLDISVDEIEEYLNQNGGIYISTSVKVLTNFLHEESLFLKNGEILYSATKKNSFYDIKPKYVEKNTHKCNCFEFLIQEKKIIKVNSFNLASDKIENFYPRKVKGPKQKIPYNIMQTFKSNILPMMKIKEMKNIIDMNPEYNYYFFGDKECKEFIFYHLGQRYLDCFNSIKPGAYKADYFRYIFLFVKGGVYFDADFRQYIPLRDFIKEEDEFLTPLDKEHSGYQGLYNAFICCTPRHKVIEKVIELCTYNIENKSIGETPYSITGPDIFAKAYQHFYPGRIEIGKKENGIEILKVSFIMSGMGNIFRDNKKFFLSKTKFDYSFKDRFRIMWINRDLYN